MKTFRFMWSLIATSIFSAFSILHADLVKQDKTASDYSKDNPALHLNSMDVPFFQQDDNPLKNMESFAVLLLMKFDSPLMRKKSEALIENELSSFGKIIHVDQKRIDLRGMGSRNFLIIDSGEVKNSDELLMPIFRISLRIQTPVTLTKTGINTSPNVWSINDFVDLSNDAHPDEKIFNALKKLLKEFKSNYNFINLGRSEKPCFYLYN